MDHRNDAISLLAAGIGEQNTVGRELVLIHRELSAGRVHEGGVALRRLVDTSSNEEFAANFELFLGASFAAECTELAGDWLAKRFKSSCRISLRLSSQISRHFIVLFEKVAPSEIALTFSNEIARHVSLEIHIAWLLRVMPLLVRVAESYKAPQGMAFLNQWDAGIIPGLSYCANGDEFFLIPDNVFIPSQGYRELKEQLAKDCVSWSERKTVAYWRGATTGQVLDKSRGWRSLQRIELCEISRRHPAIIDAGISSVVQWTGEAATEIQNSGLLKDYFPANRLQLYRYLIDVDGNSNAWGGLFQRLLTGSPVLKIASPRQYKQWYYRHLRPWHNFVPISADMSDLVHTIEWLAKHDDVARTIGANGRALAYSIEYEAELDAAVDTVAAAFRSFAAAGSASAYQITMERGPTLWTYHGTILAYSVETKILVHVAPESIVVSLSYVPLTLREIGGRLYLKMPSGDCIVDIGSDGAATVAADESLTNILPIRKVDSQTTSYAFQINNKYMCAEGDGRITVSRNVVSFWELFSARSG